MTNGSPNPTLPPTPLISDEVVWEINGKELDIRLLVDETFAKLKEGKHEIAIETGLNALQFLLIDGDDFGVITVTEGRLVLNTRNKPNESVSHAPTI